MGDPLKRVQRGQPLRIPAETFNTFIDVAKAHQQAQQRSGVRHESLLSPGVILVQNNSGIDVDQYEVLGISGVIIDPDDNEDEFRRQVALTAITPAASHAGKFVITAEPIADGEIGQARVAGVSPVMIDWPTDGNDYKLADVSGWGFLEASWLGSAQVLWRAGGTGVQWAIVRFGISPFGAVAACGGGPSALGAVAPSAPGGSTSS